jgi:hypothetical protein
VKPLPVMKFMLEVNGVKRIGVMAESDTLRRT